MLKRNYIFHNIIFLIPSPAYLYSNYMLCIICKICSDMKIMFISDTAILFLPCWGLGSMMKISLLHKIGNLALTCSYIKNIKFSQRVILANICIEIALTITMQGRTYMHNYVTYLIQSLQALQY